MGTSAGWDTPIGPAIFSASRHEQGYVLLLQQFLFCHENPYAKPGEMNHMELTIPEACSGTLAKIGVLVLSTVFTSITTVFSLINNIQVVFTHLYYIPIILAAYWYKKAGVVFTFFLSAFYLGSVYVFSTPDLQTISAAVARVVIFIGISLVITVLSMRIDRQQEQIGRSEARFRGIWESVQAGIILVDPKTHTIIAANPEAEKLTGFSEEQMIGHHCHTFICPAEQGKCPISDLGMKVDRTERVLLTRDGRKVPVLKTVTELTLGGEQIYIESFIDITPVKDVENALIAYIREATLRIRNPVELVRDNIHEIRDELVGLKDQSPHIVTALIIQEKNMDGILKNLQELDQAIAEKQTEIPDALKEYLKR